MSHTHTQTDELHVFFVPADLRLKCEVKVIRNKWQEMNKLVDGYIEIVRTPIMPKLPCGCLAVMVVNEEGLIHRLPQNHRASSFYPGPIMGDVFLIGEGPVTQKTVREGMSDLEEIDFFSLPQEISRWSGPPAPVPDLTPGWGQK